MLRSEALRPGVVDWLGVGPAAVHEVDRRVVYCPISTFCQTGALASREAHVFST
ncbi:CoA transferase [Rhodoferax ferrireducens]|uniref:CoA transferase n=1 Tax=Rhodoferax ferrireducens TaxID=192843 RepID=UPI001FC87B23|nr:CoA transferase [Rhodoferax ferrireducens]